MIGSLFTLAGETLSAIGRMIERPAFNDDAAEQFLGGRWESDVTDVADALAHEHDPLCYPGFCTDECTYPRTSAATPDLRQNAPTPSTPRAGLGHLTSQGAAGVSQPAAASGPREAVDATEHHTSGGGVDRPLSEVLGEAAALLDQLSTRVNARLSDAVTLSYVNDALMLVPELRDIAAQFRAIDE